MGKYNTLCSEIHDANVKAGWWSDIKTGERVERNVPEMLMLMVSEIAEASEAVLDDNAFDDKLPQYPGWVVELADQNIRIFDLCGYLKTDMDKIMEVVGDEDSLFDEVMDDIATGADDFDIAGMHLVRHIARAMEGHRRKQMDKKFPEYTMIDVALTMAVRDAYKITAASDIDLDTIIQAKREFNAKREDHKVENRLKEGGKAY